MYYNFSRNIGHRLREDPPKILPLPQMWKYKSDQNQWFPRGMDPNIFLFDRTQLCDENGVGKIWYLFLSNKYFGFYNFFVVKCKKVAKIVIFLR